MGVEGWDRDGRGRGRVGEGGGGEERGEGGGGGGGERREESKRSGRRGEWIGIP